MKRRCGEWKHGKEQKTKYGKCVDEGDVVQFIDAYTLWDMDGSFMTFHLRGDGAIILSLYL